MRISLRSPHPAISTSKRYLPIPHPRHLIRVTSPSLSHSARLVARPSSTWSRPAYAWHEDVESLERYRPGGYHPIHLGDKLGAGRRYEVVYKLGYGSYSTVWLCKDTKTGQCVSVKVAVSETGRKQNSELDIFHALGNGDSEHPGKSFVISLYDEFTLEGPNGSHQCFVFPVALNSVAIAKEASTIENTMFAAPVARSIVVQVLLALSYIHSCGVVHAGMLLFESFRLNHFLLFRRSPHPEHSDPGPTVQIMATGGSLRVPRAFRSPKI